MWIHFKLLNGDRELTSILREKTSLKEYLQKKEDKLEVVKTSSQAKSF